MIYASQTDNLTIVAAADTLAEYVDFVAKATSMESPPYVEYRTPSVVEMMTEESFTGFRKEPVVFEHADSAEAARFAEVFSLSVIRSKVLRSRQSAMLDLLQDDPYSHESTETRTIAEIHGITADNDPWDKRTEQQRQAEAEGKRKAEEARKKGNLSGDSFGGKGAKKPGDDKNVTRLTDVRVSENADGSVNIDTAVARQFKGKGGEEDAAPEVEGADRRKVNFDGAAKLFHVVEVTGAGLAEIASFVPAYAVDRADISTGCWFAVLLQRQAKDAVDRLSGAGFQAEYYVLNRNGKLAVPKGIEIAEKDTEVEPPMPWNEGAAEYAAMDEEARKAAHKALKPHMFLVSGYYGGAGHGTDVFVVPKSAWAKRRELWDTSLPIEGLLPRDFKEVSPGHYRTRSRDWNNASLELLNGKGFVESIDLNLWVNSL